MTHQLAQSYFEDVYEMRAAAEGFGAREGTAAGDHRIEQLRRIVEEHQHATVDGSIVDAYTASAIMNIYDALNQQNQEKYANLPVQKMAEIAWDLLKVDRSAVAAAERRQEPSEISHVLFLASRWTPEEARDWLNAHDFDRHSDLERMESEGGEKLEKGEYLVYRVVPESVVKGFTSFGYGDELPDGVWFKFGGHRGRGARERLQVEVVRPTQDDLEAMVRAAGYEIGPTMETDDIIYVASVEGEGPAFEVRYEKDSGRIDARGVRVAKGPKTESWPALSARDHLGADGRYFVDYGIGGTVVTTGPFGDEAQAMVTADHISGLGYAISSVYETDPSGDTFTLDWEEPR